LEWNLFYFLCAKVLKGFKMIIDLKGMETTVLPNFKGGEKEYKAKMYFDGTTRIMRGTLEQYIN